ncbi:hypothetical protein Oweho_0960 [Owenweeksia hongkongensis DSM 17368]|uniref:Uncharacterized protein n=1 Tax=Owenweeksia hongkongensis (strain DSM 17368 / CIP 108786 / JCM 12287 / NRRL B-23963 / UST20020801) TaxID=926562 RepID=G8R3E9_OWEHD|nr:hypothetical protein Oweho_0960 [Owenweeksia hongkongensis DSM 17368]
MAYFNKAILKELIPVYPSILIVFGYLKLSLYYQFFGVQIINFIDFTEIIILFLPDVIYYLVLLSLSVFLHYVIAPSGYGAFVNVSEDHVSEKYLVNRFIKYFKYHFWYSISLIICFILVVVAYYLHRPNFSFLLLITLFSTLLYILGYFLSEIHRKHLLNSGKQLSATVHNIISVIVLFSFFTISNVSKEIRSSLNNPSIVNFKYQGNQIATNSECVYLGETRNYIFIQDKSSENAYVYPKDDISEFIISKTDESLILLQLLTR